VGTVLVEGFLIPQQQRQRAYRMQISSYDWWVYIYMCKCRYCGYCAWRGVLDSSTVEATNLKADLLKLYPDLGHCLYFNINVAERTHAVLYELTQERLNWLWYINQPEPNLKASNHKSLYVYRYARLRSLSLVWC
jgi:hypothetical protein